MIREGVRRCPECGGELAGYDTAKRVMRMGDRGKRTVYIHRFRCKNCKRVHRELPEYLNAYKQYEKGVYEGMLDGHLNSDTLGYENYPAELTILRWKREKNKE